MHLPIFFFEVLEVSNGTGIDGAIVHTVEGITLRGWCANYGPASVSSLAWPFQ